MTLKGCIVMMMLPLLIEEYLKNPDIVLMILRSKMKAIFCEDFIAIKILEQLMKEHLLNLSNRDYKKNYLPLNLSPISDSF